MGLDEAAAGIRADDPRQRHYDSSETWEFHTAAENQCACRSPTDAPVPDFDDVYSDLNVAGQLLAALATGAQGG